MAHKPKCKMRTTKCLKDNIRENLDDLEYGDAFLSKIPKTQYIK